MANTTQEGPSNASRSGVPDLYFSCDVEADGLVFTRLADLAQVRRCDVLCVPGGPGVSAIMEDAEVLAFLREHAGRVRFEVKDALKIDSQNDEERYKGVISGMLAEHLLDPKPLFTTMSKRVDRGGLVFFSTALESPQRDHVFEYNDESQPLEMAEAVGLRAVRLASDASAVPPGSRFLPRAIAMILRSR